MEPRLPQDPVQLRALLLKVLGGSRGRAAALQAEFEGLGGHAPAPANPTEPSAEKLECEESPAALQQLIRQALKHWYRQRSKLEAAIAGTKDFARKFLEPEEADALMKCLVAERPPYMVKYN